MATEDPTLPAAKPPALAWVSGQSLRVTEHLENHERDRAEIMALADMIGVTPAAADLLDYVRLGDASSKGLWVPASSVVGLNPLVNGGFTVWQDGATFTSIADGTWGPDNWIYGKAGAVVHDLLRSTDVPTVAQAQRVSYSCQLDVTTADAALAAGDYATLATRIEGSNWARFDQKAWSIRFWVKAAKTGVHYVYARNSGSDRSCVIAYTVNVADTWEEKQVAFPASPAAGTWDFTNGRGLELGWTLAAGSTFQTTAGAWQTGDFKAASDQVNELDNAANNFRIAMVGRPTLGPNAVPYVSADPGLEEWRCKRYNELLGGVSLYPYGDGHNSSTTQAEVTVPVAPKRSTSSIAAIGTIGNIRVYVAGSTLAVTGLTLLASLAGQRTIWVRVTVAAGLTAGAAVKLINNTGATEQIAVRSRIP